jgi:hypothetical protein
MQTIAAGSGSGLVSRASYVQHGGLRCDYIHTPEVVDSCVPVPVPAPAPAPAPAPGLVPVASPNGAGSAEAATDTSRRLLGPVALVTLRGLPLDR